MENKGMSTSPDGFPNPLVDKKTKDSKEYILQYCRAMYAQFGKFGMRAFWNDRSNYDVLESYALGIQMIDKYKKRMDVWENEPGRNAYLNIDWQVINLASKFVNIIVDKIVGAGYDVECRAIDPLALEARKEKESKMRAVMEHQKWFEETGIALDPDALGFSPDMLPDHSDDLELHMAMNYKDLFSMNAEMAIDLHFTNNEFEQVRREYIRDSVIYGPKVVETINDSYGNTKIKRISPKTLIIGNSKSEDFKNTAHGGYIENMSFAELQAEAGSKFNQDEWDKIYKDYSTLMGSTQVDNWDLYRTGLYQNTNERMVSVMKFYYKTTIQNTYVKKNDKRGNARIYEQGPNTKEKEGQKLIKDSYEVVYEGKWIVGSNYIYDYGMLKDMQVDENNPCATKIPLHVIWPNMLNGRGSSILSYCIPVFDLIQINWLNFQNMLARIRPDGEAINIDALVDIAFGSGGTKLTPKENISMYYKTGSFFFSSKSLDGNQNGNALPVIPLNNNNAAKAEVYLNNVFSLINVLRQITGMNEGVDASTPGPKALVGTMEMAAAGANSAIGYLFTADKLMVKHIAESCIRLTQNAIRRGDISGYVSSVGMGAVNFWKVNKDITQRQLGIKIVPRPTEAEWSDFYTRISGMAEKGLITASDLIVMQEMTNLKQARQYLSMVERRRKRAEAQQQQMLMEQQAALNQQAAQATAQSNQQAIELEMRLKAQLLQLEKEKNIEEMNVKYGYEMQLMQMQMSQKEDAANTQSRTKIIDTALKSEAARKIAEEKSKEVKKVKATA